MLSLVRSYTYNFPIDRGKGRVFKLAKKLCPQPSRDIVVPTRDGRRLEVGFRDWAEDLIYFMGTYESFATEVISRYVKPGCVSLDVGANIGWYTTLFQSLGAEVHSFEPAPNAFESLKRNVQLNCHPADNVSLNNFGLGAETAIANLHILADEPEGHATLSDLPASSSIPIEIRTLDSYLIEKGVDKVDILKVDIEGSELAFLKGATRLFKQFVPPVMLIEMSAGVAVRSGYTTNDLIAFLRPYYELFEVDEKRRELIPVGDSVNANALCIPK